MNRYIIIWYQVLFVSQLEAGNNLDLFFLRPWKYKWSEHGSYSNVPLLKENTPVLNNYSRLAVFHSDHLNWPPWYDLICGKWCKAKTHETRHVVISRHDDLLMCWSRHDHLPNLSSMREDNWFSNVR